MILEERERRDEMRSAKKEEGRTRSARQELRSGRLRWPSWAVLGLIGLMALATRLVLAQGERVVWGDEPFYLWLGRNWVSGKGYAFVGRADVHHGPLFPCLAGLLYLVTGDLALSSEILYMVFGSLLVWPVYAMGKELYGRRVGLIAAALVAVFPALTASVLHWGSMTEPLYMFWVYLGLWAGLAICFAPSPVPLGVYPLAGLSFGLAYLTRPEAIGYWVVVGAFVVLLKAFQGARRGRLGLQMALYALAFGLAFGPYAYYTRLHTGSWMVSQKVGVAYLTGIGLAHGDTAAFDKATWGLDSTGLETFFFSSESYHVSMVSLIRADPRTFLEVLSLNALRFVQVLVDWSLFPNVLLPLVGLGLFRRGWTRERTLKELYLLLSIAPVASFTLFFIQARYLVPFIPVMILWLANGLAELGDWIVATVGRGRVLASVGPVVLVMAMLLIAQPYVVRQVTHVGSVRPAHKSVGEHLRRILPRDALLMSRYPAIAFHADVRWVPTPNAPLPEVLNYARHKGVQYWAIDERELAYRPQFRELVMSKQAPPGLRLIYADAPEGEWLVVYALD